MDTACVGILQDSLGLFPPGIRSSREEKVDFKLDHGQGIGLFFVIVPLGILRVDGYPRKGLCWILARGWLYRITIVGMWSIDGWECGNRKDQIARIRI